jgi:SAM-dependent methyltransferase
MVRDAVRAGAAAVLGRAPDRDRALARYRAVAGDYDLLTIAGEPYRRLAVRALDLRPGEVVLDVGCGTGLNFAQLGAAVGADGWVIGIEQCHEMLTRAAERASGPAELTLVEMGAEDADVPVCADAALLCGTHDILRSERTLRNVLRHLRPGGRVVAAGAKWAPWWKAGAVALNLWTWQVNRPYVTTFEGFDRPWSRLERLVGGLAVRELLFGGGYVAVGTVPGRKGADYRAAAAQPVGSSPVR